jgi:carboxylesterase type B
MDWEEDLVYVSSEDCLFLNIFVPSSASPLNPLPVLVFIHGGGSTDGSSNEYDDLKSIAYRGHAILVTLNYRLNVFGWLSLAELSATDPRGSSGNYGLLDQREALLWLQSNIANFGGDPARVTVFGQSSGGTHILAYLASPSFKGLFAAGISLSGSPNISMSLRDAEALNAPFVATCRCNGKGSASAIVACLRGLDVKQVHACIPKLWSAAIPNSPPPTEAPAQPGIVIVDGQTVVTDVFSGVRRAIVDVPMIITTMAQENGMGPAKMVRGWSRERLVDYLNQFWGSSWQGAHFGDRVMQLYDSDKSVLPTFEAQHYYDTIGSDPEVTCGCIALATAAGRSFKSPVYSGYTIQGPSHDFYSHDDAFHMWDLIAAGQMWGTLFKPTDADRAFGDNILSHWLEMAYHLELSPASGWKSIQSALTGSYNGALLSSNTTSVQNLLMEKCDFWTAAGVGEDYWWAN